MTVLLDTSFIIAFDNTQDVHHNKSRELWKKIENGDYGGYFISDYIFDEVLAVTMRKIDKNRANVLGQHILESIPMVNVDKHLFDASWKTFKESKLNLSFTDCTNLVIMKMVDAKFIATFDKEFKKTETTVLDG